MKAFLERVKPINLSVVLPCYNEENNIKDAVEQIISFCNASPLIKDFELVIVNDGSTDRSLEVLQSLKIANNEYITVINHQRNLGYGASLKDGFVNSSKEWIFFTDSDGQFNINELNKFLPYTSQFTFISGLRRYRKDPFIRKLNAGVFNLFAKLFYRIKLNDIDCAFKLFKKNIFNLSDIKTKGALINTELIYRAQKNKARFQQIDVTHYERKYGTSTGGNIRVIAKAMKEFISLRIFLFKTLSDIEKFNSLLVGIFAFITIALATTWSYQNNVILAYGDAEAHLNIAKRVVGGLTPGFSQLGGVWLPFPHIMLLPFVWNDFLWRSGLAGSFASGIAFIWGSIILYKLSFFVTKKYIASFIAPFVFILNPNVAYLATTPMSEIILFSSVVTSMYFFIKWVYTDHFLSLSFAAFFGFLASLSRYDGWFLVCAEAILVIFFSAIRHKSYKKTEGRLILYAVLAFFGILLWLLWNTLIFNNPLYFANSDYGSKNQQMWFHERGYLPTYGNLPLSILYYVANSYIVIGGIVFGIGIMGFLMFLYNLLNISRNFDIRKLSILLLFSPLVFYSISLFTGQASLILPIFSKPWYEWEMSNVRYGIQMIIPIGFFCAFLASKIRYATIILTIAFSFQFIFQVVTGNAIVYQDGTNGLSSQKISKGPDAPPVEKWISKNYDGGLVLMDDYRRPISPVNSSVPMNNFIGVGNKPYWNDSLTNPTLHADWVILQKASTDVVWTGMKNKQILNDHYINVYKSGNIWVYKKRNTQGHFVRKSGNEFFLDEKRIIFKGVNVYDILQLTKEEIDYLINNFTEERINSVRFWAFNKEGVMTDREFEAFDYLITKAYENNIYLLPVLGNHWEDYGGPSNFGDINSPDQFYLDKDFIQKFKQHIENVLTHQNSLNGVEYRNEAIIMSWEILNEPRSEQDPTNNTVTTWVEHIGQYIGIIDNNHLISVGTEGFMGKDNNSPYHEDHGSNLDAICQLSIIDMCSVHLYPKYLQNNPTKENIEKLINEWQQISFKNKKPIYIGEVGFDLSVYDEEEQYTKRTEFFRNLFTITSRKNINGVFIWNVTFGHNDYFSLSFNDVNDRRLFQLWNRVWIRNQPFVLFSLIRT